MRSIFILCSMFFVLGCIGDDIIDDRVPEAVRFTSCVDTLALGENFQLEAQFYDEIGRETEASLFWSSSDDQILSVNQSGLITGNKKGSATIFVNYDSFTIPASDEKVIVVDENTVMSSDDKEGTIVTTSSYQLEGTFTATQAGNNLLLSFNEDFKASTALPGLYLYMTNNPTTNAGALEVKAVDVYSGAHEITVPNTDINEYQFLLYYCKPFSVKVGEGELE